MDFPVSPRVVSRTARTSVLTDDSCPGLTEIKDVRIHNNLLEEIFNVEDSIELDYFELERQEANFDSYLSGYNSPSNACSSVELKQNDTGSYKAFGIEHNSYQLHELQNRRCENKDSVANGNQCKGLSVTRPGTYENSGRELIAVASPTISSTCEGSVAGSAMVGIGNISSDSPNAVTVNDTTSVHSTTNASGNDLMLSTDKPVIDKVQPYDNDLPSMCEKELLTAVEPVPSHDTRANVRPRAETRSRGGNVSQQMALINGTCLSPPADISGNSVVPPISSDGQVPGGDSTTASSSSTSPSQLHVTKRQRVIDCGSDLLAEVRQAYEYVQGADLYAPSVHPTFTKLDSAGVTTAFQPNTDRNGRPQMNLNFTGQEDNLPVAFTGNSRVGDRMKGPVQQAGIPYGGNHGTGSPSVTYQSCPDLASPGRQQGREMVNYCRLTPQKFLTDELSAASLSAPTTPSKRAGPWSVNSQHLRSPLSPSMQPQACWRPNVSMHPREHNMPIQLGCQNVVMNNGQRVLAPHGEQTHYENIYDQQFSQFSRPQSPLARRGKPVFHHADQCRGHYMQPPENFPESQMPVPDGHVSQHPAAVRMNEGTPLSQNAFLRRIMDDESLVFRSHPCLLYTSPSPRD